MYSSVLDPDENTGRPIWKIQQDNRESDQKSQNHGANNKVKNMVINISQRGNMEWGYNILQYIEDCWREEDNDLFFMFWWTGFTIRVYKLKLQQEKLVSGIGNFFWS